MATTFGYTQKYFTALTTLPLFRSDLDYAADGGINLPFNWSGTRLAAGVTYVGSGASTSQSFNAFQSRYYPEQYADTRAIMFDHVRRAQGDPEWNSPTQEFAGWDPGDSFTPKPDRGAVFDGSFVGLTQSWEHVQGLLLPSGYQMSYGQAINEIQWSKNWYSQRIGFDFNRLGLLNGLVPGFNYSTGALPPGALSANFGIADVSVNLWPSGDPQDDTQRRIATNGSLYYNGCDAAVPNGGKVRWGDSAISEQSRWSSRTPQDKWMLPEELARPLRGSAILGHLNYSGATQGVRASTTAIVPRTLTAEELTYLDRYGLENYRYGNFANETPTLRWPSWEGVVTGLSDPNFDSTYTNLEPGQAPEDKTFLRGDGTNANYWARYLIDGTITCRAYVRFRIEIDSNSCQLPATGPVAYRGNDLSLVGVKQGAQFYRRVP